MIMPGIVRYLAVAGLANTTLAAPLETYNIDPSSVSVSGLSSGGYMAVQLGVAYSGTFQAGFGVFAGGPYDCARNQYLHVQSESLHHHPTANMESWSGNQIDPISNLKSRRIYMQVGLADTTVGPNVMGRLKSQLSNFGTSSYMTYITTSGAGHTFPTDFDASGGNHCSDSSSPYISNCGYDGAGAVLQWMYGALNARNMGPLTGDVIPYSQTSSYGANGMATTGYLYVPAACKDRSTVCKLHVALHGCLQSYGQIGSKFINNTGYNKWADTNDIIILYPQATTDNSLHTVWNGALLSNSNACWDWLGWYGSNADQKGGAQMTAIVNQVRRIMGDN
ncbi:uncharacterized protein P174DRAFT_516263 [Aspergillus novofumigatus IBT 16806]|uniref:Uncharacterized protein n=1 Tax=Aspergillus novofumigatus (strain IBT 16806) TaxID=1392255 RepID=A0A2I1BUX1_ASPN1|nr:uncharacterized protein P174DRAFT_516263 [Aspergillus novofumigatus IBT 16806]PKX89101.1 hypothetical protein P174DRAFT_516263 [Aspergillus novofumigatus IBT 16806]